MAPTARYIDLDAFERLVGEGEGQISMSELARRLVRIRQGQTASEKQEENARRQIQKWKEGKGVGALNVRRLSEALGSDPDEFLLPDEEEQPPEAAPMGLMREALQNQLQMKNRWEEVADRLEALEAGQEEIAQSLRAVLERIEAALSRARASR